LTWP